MAASVVIIEERTGRQRRVELVGGGLPLQGANWSGLQLLATAWNPGNSEATQHVLGPQEVPSDWDFEWNTTRINRTPIKVTDGEQRTEFEISRAHSLAILLDEIFRGGALLKVSWISKAAAQSRRSPRQTRIGRAASWSFNYDRPDDIMGAVSFVWIGRGEDQPKAGTLQGEDMLAVTQAAINAANEVANAIANNFIRSANRRDPGPSTFTLGQLESLADGPLETMDSFARFANSISNRMKRIGDLIIKVSELPAAITGQLLDVANNGVAVANQFVDALSRESPETQSNRIKVSTLTRNATYLSETQTKAERMASIMELVAEAARKRQNSTIPSPGTSRRQDKTRNDDNFKVHVPRETDTMISIAQQYYGSPDLADELAVANGLPSYTIKPPKIPIIIPTRRRLEEANRNRI